MRVKAAMLAGLIGLAGCAPGDTALKPADLAARGRTVELRETVTHLVRPGTQGPLYWMSCLDGWTPRRGSADIVAITGRATRERDYRLGAHIHPWSHELIARVRHVGPARAEAWVTVELRLTCDAP